MKKLLLILALAAAPLFAEPVTLSRTDAFALYDALGAINTGLAPANTASAADDISALEATATGLRRAATVLERQRLTATTPELAAKYVEAAAALDREAEATLKTYELAIFTLSPSEIENAKISPRQLSVIRRLLKPDPKPTAPPKS